MRSTREGEHYNMLLGISQHVVKEQKLFDYLRFKDDDTHYLNIVRSASGCGRDVLLRSVINANRQVVVVRMNAQLIIRTGLLKQSRTSSKNLIQLHAS